MPDVTNILPRIKLQVALHKRMESPEDCQDACASNPRRKRFAIADGVSQSFFPAEWARLLVWHFCEADTDDNVFLFQTNDWTKWLKPIREQWLSRVTYFVLQKTGPENAHLSNGLAEQKAAGAAFVGIELDLSAREGPVWQAMIMGDSCLFHLRDGQVNSHLLKRSSEFDNHPNQLASRNLRQKDEPCFLKERLRIGDTFILATDALAKWLLARIEAGPAAWQETWDRLRKISTHQAFNAFVRKAQESTHEALENDDISIIIVTTDDKNSDSSTEWSPEKTRQVPEEKKWIPVNTNTARSSPAPPQPAAYRRASPLWLLCLMVVCLVSVGINFFFLRNWLAPSPAQVDSQRLEILLVPGEHIYSFPDDRSQRILTVQRTVTARTLKQINTSFGAWKEIQLEAWIASSFSEAESDAPEDQEIFISQDTIARSAPFTPLVGIGTIRKGTVIQKLEERADGADEQTGTIWYLIRVVGFIPR